MIQQVKKLERQEKILSSLDKLQYATVKQLNRIQNLSSDRNCYRILQEMKKEKLVNCIKREMNIYHLTKEGRDLIGSEKELPKARVLDHILMRNDLYIYLGNPQTWKIEQQVEIGNEIIRADAFYTKQRSQQLQDHYFIEVDHTNPMSENRKKILQYQKLNDAFKRKNGFEIKVIFYTIGEVRRRHLKTFAEGKVPVEVYTIDDIR
mgnify:CR=1 FL=1